MTSAPNPRSGDPPSSAGPAARLPHWALPALLGALWLTAIIALAVYERRTGVAVPTCLFRTLTGHPCPTCGSTRAGLRLLAIDVPGALAFNPLMTLAMLAAPPWVLWRLLRRPGPGPRPRRLTGSAQAALLIALLLINWAYVIAAGV